MSMRECVCVTRGERGVLDCVEIRGKTNILHHVPSHTFPHWLFKSSCQGWLSDSLSLCLGSRELPSTFPHTELLDLILDQKSFKKSKPQPVWGQWTTSRLEVKDASLSERPGAAPAAASSLRPGAADHYVQGMSHLQIQVHACRFKHHLTGCWRTMRGLHSELRPWSALCTSRGRAQASPCPARGQGGLHQRQQHHPYPECPDLR